jgi:uncharacterized phage protein (TIGR01671 family)
VSRPIKFRVWCEKIKKFRRSDIDGPKNSAWGVSVNRGIFEIPNSESQIVELFTGLLDSEGKEIYEGDIIRWSDYQGWESGEIVYGYYIVKWNEACLRLDFYDPFESLWWELNDTCFDNVVGNIHENPELLPA